MRVFLVLCALGLGLGGCTTPLSVEGAPCPCPDGYTCDAHERCAPAGALGTGGVGGMGGVGGTGGTTKPNDDHGGKPPAPPPACTVDPGPTVVRRLDAEEYANSVLDLLGVVIDTSGLPHDTRLPDYGADQMTPSLSPEQAAVYTQAAKDAAAQAAQHLTRIVPCLDPAGENTCARMFAEAWGPKAYRRPLAASEVEDLLIAFEQGRHDNGGELGIRRMIELALSSTPFVLRIDHGVGAEPGQRVVRLTPWEIATRLSYFLRRTTPDDQLRQSAAAGALATAEGVRAQAERLLDQDRSRADAMVSAFHRRWLQLDTASIPDKPAVSPPFDGDLRTALVTAGQQTAGLRFGVGEGDQTSLFTGRLVGNRAMAVFYDLTLPAGTGFEELDPLRTQKRFGILTLPALLARLAAGADSSPTQRGHFITSELTCVLVPGPPGAIPPLQGRSASVVTTRQRYIEHVVNPSCAVCHQLMDPIGFGLENYDGYGRWRVMENGQPVDPTGTGTILMQDFDGPAGLADILAKSDEVSQCLVQQWFRFAVGRAIDADDACTVQVLHQAFVEGGRKLRPLLLAIATSEAFLTRRAP